MDVMAAERSSERATERVAMLMTPTEKAAFADRAQTLGMSLGQFFRLAGAAYASQDAHDAADQTGLNAVLNALELSTARTERALDAALAEVKAALGTEP